MGVLDAKSILGLCMSNAPLPWSRDQDCSLEYTTSQGVMAKSMFDLHGFLGPWSPSLVLNIIWCLKALQGSFRHDPGLSFFTSSKFACRAQPIAPPEARSSGNYTSQPESVSSND